MKNKMLLLLFFSFFTVQGMTQDRWIDTVPLVDIQDIQLQKVLYSFEKRAKKFGLISPESPNFVRVSMQYKKDNKTSLEITIEDGYCVPLYMGIPQKQSPRDDIEDDSLIPLNLSKKRQPFMACHTHDDCLFLFCRNVDSAYLKYSGSNIILRYSNYQGLPIFMIDTNDCPELSRILFAYQSTGKTIEKPFRDTVIRSLENVATRRIMKECWEIHGNKIQKVDQLIEIPHKRDIILYKDDVLIVFSE
jgi:hypothetical protein